MHGADVREQCRRMRSLIARMEVHMRNPIYTSTNRDRMAASASDTATPMSMASHLMNTTFPPTTSAVAAAVGHNARYCSAQCNLKLSSASRWWCPGLCRCFLVDVVPRHNPKWLSNTSFRHVFGPQVFMRILTAYVPNTKASLFLGGRATPGMPHTFAHAQHTHSIPPLVVN